MLEDKNVNLRVVEKEDLPLIAEWFSSSDVFGEDNTLRQMSKTEAEKMFESSLELKTFIIEEKERRKQGWFCKPLLRLAPCS